MAIFSSRQGCERLLHYVRNDGPILKVSDVTGDEARSRPCEERQRRGNPALARKSGDCVARRNGLRTNGTDLSRYGLLLKEMSAAGKPPSSLHGRIHGVFRKK